MTLTEHLRTDAPSMPAIAAHLDALAPAQRLLETQQLSAKDQSKLFDLAQGFRPMSLDALTPAATPNMTGVAHEGTNSLPLFRAFAKVFYRPDGPAAATERWGYNRNSAVVETAVGPGYYVAYMLPSGEALVDYLRQPPARLPNAPPLISNGARLSRFVYYQTQDVLRRVSEHVSIGRASRGGKPMPNWFVLCRTAA